MRLNLQDTAVVEILLSDTLTRKAKAEMLEVTEAYISRLTKKLGKPDGRRKVTIEQEEEIRRDTRSHTEIATDFGISAYRVSDIKRRAP